MDPLKNGFDNKKILITGGNGFIGSHLVKRLVGYGAWVTVIVRDESDLWRIADYLNDIEIRKVDIREKNRLKSCLRSIDAEYVFHMSAYGVDYRKNNVLEAVKTNILGTINLVEALSGIGCKKMLNAGSGMEYGCCEINVTEEMRLTPNSIYGSTKAGAAIIAHQIADETDISLVTLRPFGVFGEFEDSSRLFAHIILSVLSGDDVRLTLCEQFRDYTYVGNIVDGFLMSALNEGLKNEIMNIGSGSSHQLRYFVELIYNYLESDKAPLFGAVPYRQNDLCTAVPDVSKIRALLGWEPRVALEPGIEKTVNWFRDNKKKYKQEI